MNGAAILTPASPTYDRSDNAFADFGEAANSAITRPVTIGYRVDHPTVIAIRDMSHVIASIRSGSVEGNDLRPLLAVIRAATSNPDLRQQLKRQLPYFLASVCERKRANANVKFAWFAIFDLDHVGDQEQTKQAIVDNVPFARYIFNSVTDGVKIIAEFDKAVNNEKIFVNIYDFLASRIEARTGFQPDATHDWARACYFSWDPRLIVNPRGKTVNIAQAWQAWKVWDELTACQRQAPVVTGLTPDVIPGLTPDVVPGLTRDPFLTERSANPEQKTGSRLATPQSGDPGVRDDTQCNEDPDPELAQHVIELLCKMRIQYNDWITIGYALYYSFGEKGRDLWLLFRNNGHYRDSGRYLMKKWNSFRNADGRSNWNTFLSLARDYGCL